MSHIVIAIDGPAASGKSSVSKELARQLGYVYVNTGAMYRAVTWHALHSGVDPSDSHGVLHLLDGSSLECGIENGQSSFRVNGTDPGDALVSQEVNGAVSKVASQPEVRRRLVALQRTYAQLQASVMEGRDIGSAVFPDTPYKFYIDASVEVRAARRAGQGLADSVALRDAMDKTRKDSPLLVPQGAHVIDSSLMTVGEVVKIILEALNPLGIHPAAH